MYGKGEWRDVLVAINDEQTKHVRSLYKHPHRRMTHLCSGLVPPRGGSPSVAGRHGGATGLFCIHGYSSDYFLCCKQFGLNSPSGF